MISSNYVISYDKIKLKVRLKYNSDNDFYINGNIFDPVKESEVNRFHRFFVNLSNTSNTPNTPNTPNIYSKDEVIIFKQSNFLLILDNDYYRSKSYKYCFSILYNNSLIGHLSFTPFNPIFRGDLMCLDFDNRFLYTNNFRNIIALFFETFELSLNNIEVIEVCLDTNINVLNKFKYITNRLGSVYRYNRKNIKNGLIYSESVINKIENDNKINVGNGVYSINMNDIKEKSKRLYDTFKIYNKSDEVRMRTYKEYILEYLSNNGLDTSNDVYRLEFSILGRSIKKRKIKFNLLNILDSSKINELFEKYYDVYLDFRLNDKKEKRFSRLQKIKKIYL